MLEVCTYVSLWLVTARSLRAFKHNGECTHCFGSAVPGQYVFSEGPIRGFRNPENTHMPHFESNTCYEYIVHHIINYISVWMSLIYPVAFVYSSRNGLFRLQGLSYIIYIYIHVCFFTILQFRAGSGQNFGA